jgi:putative membrane protein insertion efficiency factor
MRGAVRPGVWAAGLVVAYQRFVSPVLGRHCRFAPTCSEYARQVLIDQGLLRGAWLGLVRLAKCHPLHPGGLDPPPVRKTGSKP